MNFADQLRDERKRLGLTQAGFHSQQQQTVEQAEEISRPLLGSKTGVIKIQYVGHA